MKILSTFLSECLTLSLLAAKKAGDAILAVYQGHIDVAYKEDETPLTLADERAHTIILNDLSTQAFGQIPVLSEEGKPIAYDERKTWEYFWLVDPLDGTKEFVKRRGEFTVNIAFIKKNRPVLGVVFVPARALLYFAAEGLGSYKLESAKIIGEFFSEEGGISKGNVPIGQLIDSAKKLPLDQPTNTRGKKLTIVGSRSHASNTLTSFVETARKKYGDVEYIPAGSALKFGLIAEGSAHIYPRLSPTMEWDTAAGQCVVEQSGGAVLRLREETPLDYNKKDLRNPDFVCTSKHSRDLHSLFQSM
jgi:3'(2'), 5'-bisphosphate nucleotidase